MLILDHYDEIIKMKMGVEIPLDSTEVHGITNEMSETSRVTIKDAMMRFIDAYTKIYKTKKSSNSKKQKCSLLVGHNIQFDVNVLCAELTILLRDPETTAVEQNKITPILKEILYDKTKKLCTMKESKKACRLPKLLYDVEKRAYAKDRSGYAIEDPARNAAGEQIERSAKLEIAHNAIFKQKTNGTLHNALVDVAVCLRIFMYIYNDAHIDICDKEHRTANNSFIYKTIRPTPLLERELPVQIGDASQIKNGISLADVKQMHAVKLPKRSRSRSGSKYRSKSGTKKNRAHSI
jgi:DNA polymerase III epsilon subunit-like protein